LKRLATGVRPMTFKKPTRAGLVALALGVLFALFLSMSVIDYSYAEEAAAAPPACAGGTTPVLENCTPNSGDTAWMLTSMATALMMTIPGLGLFYGGLGRKKKVGGTVVADFSLNSLY